MPRYVILTPTRFTERDWQRFGCGEMAAAGYEVWPVEVGQAVGLPETVHVSHGSARQVQRPSTLAALEQTIGRLQEDDIVLVEARLSSACRPLFRLLSGYRVRYAAFDLGALPQAFLRSRHAALSAAEYVSLRLEDAIGLLSRWKRLVGEMARHRFEYFRLQPPSLWLTAGTAIGPSNAGLPKVWRSRRVPVISFDTLAAMEVAARPTNPAKTAVFLDEAFVDHPDFEILGVKSPTSYERYWPTMERLFRAIEERTGLRVIVAPHPKSSGVAPAEIKARMAEAGRTADLVRDSSLVVCHSSTAVAYAVLFQRPLLFATTDEIERSWYYRGSIARMSSCFQLRRVNADRFHVREIAVPAVDEALYRRYENHYLRAPDAKLAPPWAVLREEVEARAGHGRADVDSSAGERAHVRQGVA